MHLFSGERSAGGRVFPGEHRLVSFKTDEMNHLYNIDIKDRDFGLSIKAEEASFNSSSVLVI